MTRTTGSTNMLNLTNYFCLSDWRRRKKQSAIGSVLLWVLTLPVSQAVAEPVIHLTTTVREPYSGPDLPGQGYITEITSAALQSVGYRLEVTYMPWIRAIRAASLGGSDGVMGALYSEARALDLSYSEQLVPVEILLLKRKGEAIRFRSLNDLSHYRIAFVRGEQQTFLLIQRFNLKRV